MFKGNQYKRAGLLGVLALLYAGLYPTTAHAMHIMEGM